MGSGAGRVKEKGRGQDEEIGGADKEMEEEEREQRKSARSQGGGGEKGGKGCGGQRTSHVDMS